MEKHEECGGCYLHEHKGYPKCMDECERLRWQEESKYWRNMSDQERQGWMRARDLEVD